MGALIGERGDLSNALYSGAVQMLTDMLNDDVLLLRMRAMHAIRPIMRRTPNSTDSGK